MNTTPGVREAQQHPKVAVLLATHNGARFVEPQIASLKDNAAAFTLHWLDDHSTDNTREVARAAAASAGIDLKEWHQPQHERLPGAFFRLMECVDADIYMFCDQDDIWQPGKIDAVVANLRPDVGSPVLCFSDCLMFDNDAPGVFQRVSDVLDINTPAALEESRTFMSPPAAGHTIGFTRPLREIFLKHKDVARAYAFNHDWWMYVVAQASGTPRMLVDVPTTLYRQHGNNATGVFFKRGIRYLASTWRIQRVLRQHLSRQAEGFVLAAPLLPPGPKRDRLVALAKLVATVDRRLSPAALVRLARRGVMWPNARRAAWFAASCLYSDARH